MMTWSDAGEHQQLRRVDGASAQDDLSSRVDDMRCLETIELHTNRSFVFIEDDLVVKNGRTRRMVSKVNGE